MASCLSDEKEKSLPVLTITYEELHRRSRQLSGSHHPNDVTTTTIATGTTSSSLSERAENKTTPGLLYLSPTTVVNTNDEERKPKRTKGRTRHEQTSSPQKLSTKQDRRHAPGMGRSDAAVKEGAEFPDEGLLGNRTRHKGPSHRAANDKERREPAEPKPGHDREEGSLRAEWERLLKSKKVERALAKWFGDASKLDPIMGACRKVQECAERILAQDMEAFSKWDVTNKMWKTSHYPIVEALRARMSKDEDVRESLGKFLDTAVEFYSHLLGMVESQLCFKTSDLVYDKVHFNSRTQRRKVLMAVVTIHNWYIYLGDLCRYRQQCLLSAEPNWSKPRSTRPGSLGAECLMLWSLHTRPRYYLRAQQLVPKDGKPYNQLAVLAISSHRRLDAVYYYIRSLSTRPPFDSAYDNLVGIFADSSRKAQRLEEDEKIAQERRAKAEARRQKKAEQRLKSKRSRDREKGGGGKGPGQQVQEFSSGKKEIWVMPGAKLEGLLKEEAASHDGSCDVEEMSKLSLEDPSLSPSTQASVIVRKMTSAFVLVHGKLFTRTGVETLAEAVRKTLLYCASLLRGEVRLEYGQLLFKMMVINIYSIHHAAETHSEDQSALKHYCGLSLGLTLQVATTLLSACAERMQAVATPTLSAPPPPSEEGADRLSSPSRWEEGGRRWVSSADGEMLLDYLAILVPAARILYDWFLCQTELYCRCLHSLKPAILTDFWSATVTFLNLSSDMFSGPPPDLSEHATPPTPPGLWEDRALAGFVHLKPSLSSKDTFSMPDFKKMTVQQHREQAVTRLRLLTGLCRQLWELEASGDVFPLSGLTFNAASGQFSLGSPDPEGEGQGEGEGNPEVEELDASFETERSLSFGFSDSDDDVVEELSASEDEEEGEGEESGCGQEAEGVEELEEQNHKDSEIEQLKAQRDGLVREIEGRTLAKAVANSLLSEVTSKPHRVLLIKPKYLVPDTNCFVDMLPAIRQLVERAEFVVALPLTVLTELEGLSKGSDPEGSNGVSEKRNPAAAAGAKNALEYVKATFQCKTPYLKLLTAQGSLLSSLSFRDQVAAKVSNDNLILESCLQLQLKSQPTSARPGEGDCYKVVLLTDDRNLRVKAHASDQPVKDIPNFMKLLTKRTN